MVSNIRNVWLALVGLAFFVSCSDKNSLPDEHILYGNTMGTTYSVKMVVTKDKLEETQLADLVKSELAHVNDVLSTYIDSSELSRLNQNTALSPIQISDELKTVLLEAKRLGGMTDGALDVTVGPLVNLWGFGPDKRVTHAPTQEAISERLVKTGIDLFTVSGSSISKHEPSLYIDLSSIGKGYGVDRLAELLERNGIHNYLVEVGGELRVSGKKLNGGDWRIAIEKPLSNQRTIQRLIVPKNNGIATSGDYRNYFEDNGVRYSHIIDPNTGYPIKHRLVSVTVIHQSAMTADGLATAISILGPERGFEVVKQHQIAAMLIVKTDTGFEELITESFRQYIDSSL